MQSKYITLAIIFCTEGGRRPKAIMRENVSSNSEPPQQQVLVPQLVRVPQLLTAPGIQVYLHRIVLTFYLIIVIAL